MYKDSIPQYIYNSDTRFDLGSWFVQSRSSSWYLTRHRRDVDGLDGPHLSTLAGTETLVGGAASTGDGVTEGGVSRRQSELSVEVLLGVDSPSASVIALGTSAISALC